MSILMKSINRGARWSPVSVIGGEQFDVQEGSAAFLPDGSLGFGSRPTSAWYQSRDGGHTWSSPLQLHDGEGTPERKLMKKGDLVVTPQGVAVIPLLTVTLP